MSNASPSSIGRFCASEFSILLMRDSLWRNVICRKFGEEMGGWCCLMLGEVTRVVFGKRLERC